MRRRPSSRSRRADGQRGATLVEFAIMAPFLILLLLGAIDFAWVLSQNHDLRNVANQGARLATVNSGVGADANAQRDDLIAQILARLSQGNSTQLQVSIQLEDTDSSGTAGNVGDNVVVCLRYPLSSLSGFSDIFLSGHMSSEAVFRMEQDATFSSGTSSNWGGGTCST